MRDSTILLWNPSHKMYSIYPKEFTQLYSWQGKEEATTNPRLSLYIIRWLWLLAVQVGSVVGSYSKVSY